MKKLMLVVLFLGMISAAVGEVSRRVCEADGNTPFDGRDIMVGTKLTIIISSDVNEYWVGDLAITGEDINYGVLSARDFNENTFDWEGSRFPAAGDNARVWDWEETGIDGFSFDGDDEATTGDWFIIDYTATNIGDCNVNFYEWFVNDPNRDIAFFHVRTRDFNNDTEVDFADFSMLGSYWQDNNCSEPDWCDGTDLDTTGNVDSNDLMLFADYWLERTE